MKKFFKKLLSFTEGLAKSSKEKRTSVIIAAAGMSTRFSDTKIKQLAEIDGIPVFIRSIIPFQKSLLCDEIIVVAPKDMKKEFSDFCKRYELTKVKKIVSGGDTRIKSVFSGFKAIDNNSDFVAIHDGARCLITTEQIDKVIKEAYKCDAAIAASKCTDTLKFSQDGEYIENTVDRKNIWHASTPQVFSTKLYRVALYTAPADMEFTDDAQICEQVKNTKIKLVDIGYENLKITSKSDIFVAREILKGREEKDI